MQSVVGAQTASDQIQLGHYDSFCKHMELQIKANALPPGWPFGAAYQRLVSLREACPRPSIPAPAGGEVPSPTGSNTPGVAQPPRESATENVPPPIPVAPLETDPSQASAEGNPTAPVGPPAAVNREGTWGESRPTPEPVPCKPDPSLEDNEITAAPTRPEDLRASRRPFTPSPNGASNPNVPLFVDIERSSVARRTPFKPREDSPVATGWGEHGDEGAPAPSERDEKRQVSSKRKAAALLATEAGHPPAKARRTSLHSREANRASSTVPQPPTALPPTLAFPNATQPRLTSGPPPPPPLPNHPPPPLLNRLAPPLPSSSPPPPPSCPPPSSPNTPAGSRQVPPPKLAHGLAKSPLGSSDPISSLRANTGPKVPPNSSSAVLSLVSTPADPACSLGAPPLPSSAVPAPAPPSSSVPSTFLQTFLPIMRFIVQRHQEGMHWVDISLLSGCFGLQMVQMLASTRCQSLKAMLLQARALGYVDVVCTPKILVRLRTAVQSEDVTAPAPALAPALAASVPESRPASVSSPATSAPTWSPPKTAAPGPLARVPSYMLKIALAMRHCNAQAGSIVSLAELGSALAGQTPAMLREAGCYKFLQLMQRAEEAGVLRLLWGETRSQINAQLTAEWALVLQ